MINSKHELIIKDIKSAINAGEYDVNDKITLVDGTKIIVMNDLNGNLIGIPEELKDEFYTKQFQIGDSITEEDFESWVNDVKRDIPKK